MRFTYVLLGLVTLTSLNISSGLCSNGVAGVQSDDICCGQQCMTCGGVGCSQFPGGEHACCKGTIRDDGTLCSTTSQAPCVIDECRNGVPGVESGNTCCEGQCVTCGGDNCSQRPGGANACCTSNIQDSGVACSTTLEAPCIIDVCSNGLPGVQSGDICCEAQCGTCGGSGCSQLPGGEDACCTGNISDSGTMCSESSAAPCIINDALIELS